MTSPSGAKLGGPADDGRGEVLCLYPDDDATSPELVLQHSPDSVADDDDDDESPECSPRRIFWERILHAMSIRRRRPEHDYFSTPRDDLPDGVLKPRTRRAAHPSPKELRRCRRSYVGGYVKRTLIALPFVVLMAFGVLHVWEMSMGAHLFWDFDGYDEYLPDWGKPHKPGHGPADYPTDATRDVIPIACHSHNDYWRRRPLFDAIHWGCESVEADVWLFDEELYVGHNTASLTKNRTFKNLYVNPIVDLLDNANPETEFANDTTHGVFDADPKQSLVLLVDIKTAGRDTFPYVYKQLEALRQKDYLTYWDGEKIHSRAVTVVGTGNTPFDLITSNTTYRDIFFDAPLDDLYEDETGTSPGTTPRTSGQGTVGTEHTTLDDFNNSTSYYASASFTRAVGFVWRGHLSPRQTDIIRGQIRGAQRRGLKARYWDTPSWPIHVRNHVWHVLMQEGADMLNVDDLRAAAVENWKARVHGFW